MYRSLQEFVDVLERAGELRRVAARVDTDFEVAEITDRVVKSGGPALLFEDTAAGVPVLTNMFGSRRRVELALGGGLDDVQKKLEGMFATAMGGRKMAMVPLLGRAARWMPRRVGGRGECQRVRVGSLDELPILRCWPWDGGRFVTLPLVHTVEPDGRGSNAGMYRMQVLDGLTTGMHWHVHKTGERHYRAWRQEAENDDPGRDLSPRREGLRGFSRGVRSSVHDPGKTQRNALFGDDKSRRMPVSVCLGGDPVYTYCATAPLPDGIDEYLLAGFLRGRAVRLVKCLTNELWVPSDCDFVIEGYVDTAEGKFMEGPFGDHTGFYSLEDMYPRFHVTAITRRREAIYPATVVGVPPQEDFWLQQATEKIFLPPLKLVQPEVADLHMPAAGVAHNLALVSIDGRYSGQALKVSAAMWGAGQMMFNKALLVLPACVDPRDYGAVARRVRNADLARDILMGRGVLDALDHATATPGVGGKIALDLTADRPDKTPCCDGPWRFFEEWGVVVSYDGQVDPSRLRDVNFAVLADAGARDLSPGELLWHVAGNVDPARDISLRDGVMVIDGRTKTPGGVGFPARVPNVVVSSPATVGLVDARWHEYGLGDRLSSPSLGYRPLIHSDGAEI